MKFPVLGLEYLWEKQFELHLTSRQWVLCFAMCTMLRGSGYGIRAKKSSHLSKYVSTLLDEEFTFDMVLCIATQELDTSLQLNSIVVHSLSYPKCRKVRPVSYRARLLRHRRQNSM